VNPIGAVLTVAMMLEYLGYNDASAAVERAVRETVVANETTSDLGGSLSTEQAGETIRKRLTVPNRQGTG
jgi:3-isopropylmalate dehydrogenase